MSSEIIQTEFKGIKNDVGRKFSNPEYLSECSNFVFDDIVGANKVLMPEIIQNGGNEVDIDGSFEYRYIDSNSDEQVEYILVKNGKMYTGALSTLTEIYDGLTAGKECSFTVLNDRLFVSNGTDFPVVYDGEHAWQMAAPKAKDAVTSGNLNGSYYYEMTWIIDGVESRPGTKSNTVNIINGRVTLDVPTGHPNITSRKIYRTIAGGAAPKLLTTISDNSTTSYTDNTADGSLGADIIAVNDECPKPKYITTNSSKLVGSVVEKAPFNLFSTAPNKEFFMNSRGVVEVVEGDDNTPIKGMAQSYNRIVVGSERNIYLVDVSGSLDNPQVVKTEANIGVYDGRTMVQVPDEGDFPGGVMFLSNVVDVRVFNGNIATSLSTSLDNLRTENWGQPIRGTLKSDVESAETFASAFFDYKYFLAVGEKLYVFDIRGGKWSMISIMTSSYRSIPNVLSVMDDALYIGQKGADILEKAFTVSSYRGEEYSCKISTNQLMPGKDIKFFQDLYIYFENSGDETITVKIIIEGDNRNSIIQSFNLGGASFDERDFEPDDFDTSYEDEEYKVININKYGRWAEFEITSASGLFNFRGYQLNAGEISNKEAA